MTLKKNIKKKYFVLVNAAVFKEGKLLLCQRSFKEQHSAGKWCIPGGKLETKESYNALEKTAKREVLEETGIKIQDKMKLIFNNVFEHLEDNEPVIALVFMGEYESGEAKPLDDTINVKWVAEEELDNYEFNHPTTKSYAERAFKKYKHLD